MLKPRPSQIVVIETATIAMLGSVQNFYNQPAGSTAAAPPRGLTLERIDGIQAADSPAAEAFLAGGFTAGYRGLTYRPPTRGAAVAGGR